MSRFYSEVEGAAKTVASRRGHNFIESHTRGWNHGIRVACYVNDEGNEVHQVYLTGGSNNPSNIKPIYSKEIID